MRKIVERHLAKLRQARHAPQHLEALRMQSVARLYPPQQGAVRRTHQHRIPRDAPDWYFEAELRRSGLWEMMERCYPSPQAQSQ
jgi:hypothetical protein